MEFSMVRGPNSIVRSEGERILLLRTVDFGRRTILFF